MRHEIPTHLNVEDKAFYGLSVRQVMYLMAGFSSAYALWNQSLALPFVARLVLVGACLLLAATLAFVRPYHRGLDEWAFVGLHYLALPKVCVWHPRFTEPFSNKLITEDWADWTPHVTWEEEQL